MSARRWVSWFAVALVVVAGAAVTPVGGANRAVESAALFRRMLPVLEHPRCMNCHTSTGFPRQGDDRHRHIMNVSRGGDDRGAVGLRCSTCHQRANQMASGVPGAPDWHLAPLTIPELTISARTIRDLEVQMRPPGISRATHRASSSPRLTCSPPFTRAVAA